MHGTGERLNRPELPRSGVVSFGLPLMFHDMYTDIEKCSVS